MSVMTMVKAINNALDIKLNEDSSVVIYGEDVGVEGGVFRVTEGLQKKYGVERVFDSPLAESGIVGTALGMAVSGLKPIVELQFDGFTYPAFNQIASNVSRMQNRSRGKYRVPMVIRFPYGGGVNALEHHSDSPEALFAHLPGLKVVIPSTPYDAKGLMISAIESEDPIIFMEPKRIYRAIKQDVPEDKFSIPLGKAKIVQEGSDVTLVAFGSMVRECQKAIDMAKESGISVELIDLRSIYPIDRQTIGESVRKTGRMIIVAEAHESFSVGSELVAIANEEAFLYLEAPPRRVMGYDTVVPLAQGEKYYIISPERIFYEIEKSVNF
ncbi:MAG: alpha-ketoacid dehydrogenase subunit beta [Fermentimonas sp.]|jgi:pyruvate dehydrogenase E1 component beta subunit|nr:alpha-ketoacid dehydrogenase subunit beta [Fermentimonas sp.]NLC86330.1 alpha-ketoacid dehydrogenase subunit beta [Bacteroidales bacterium]HBT85193.1 alpha-ketoacid dehydrogenase subunit beta [Porphyromonadaceae bacterium]MDD2931775.1 alpha-ketoacid dehydrogenase subunit beta [Fermentimonas sp.]MDD3189067.1 alpha-ketoacid dehydrogenase subunit beta [Fermentimonas sp.]